MTTTEKISLTGQLASLVELAQPSLGGSAYLKNLRKSALQRFTETGVPSRKNEEYKYSQPDKLLSKNYKIAGNGQLNLAADIFHIPSLQAFTAVLVNGNFSSELSRLEGLPKGVTVTGLLQASEQYKASFEKYYGNAAADNADAFTALNSAGVTDGVYVRVEDKTVIEKPLHIINIVTSREALLVSPRNLFIIGKNASISIVESFDTYDLDVDVLSNTLSEVFVAEEARVQYYKLQNDCERGSQVNNTFASVAAKAHFDTNTVTLSGSWIRNNLSIAINGEYAEVHLNGLFLTRNDQHIDNHTAVDHRVPNCQSNQLYKGILDDKSTGVFNGKIFVERDAQKTNAYQSSKNILLSDNATINTKPQLEIYADDVKCSHGSSTGQIDPDAMFYLRSRGLGEDSAKNLLMYAFAADVVNTIRLDALREYISGLIEKRLSK